VVLKNWRTGSDPADQWFSQIVELVFSTLKLGSKTSKNWVKEPALNNQFFCENHQLYELFHKPRTLLLLILKMLKKPGTRVSMILKIFKKLGPEVPWFLEIKKTKNRS
jgi:hypothetical protein